MLLRRHNIATYERIKGLFQSVNRVCCVQPTGTGKSFLMLQLIADNKDKKFLLCSPSSYIFSQIQTHAENNKIPRLGNYAPSNIVHIVINNGAHETVGGMPTVAGNMILLLSPRAAVIRTQ